MKMLQTFTSIICLFGILNCTGKSKNIDPIGIKVKDKEDNLTEIYWHLSEVNGKPVSQFPAQNKVPYIMLKEKGNRVEGTGGCNSMGGSYVLKGKNQIDFSDLIATEMACAGMELESEFYKALELIESYDSNGKELRLLNKSGDLLAVFKASSIK